jgi:hypothetical protein
MSEAGHAGDDRGESVLLKRGLDRGVEVGELAIEVQYCLRQPGHHRRRHGLSDDRCALGVRGFDRAGGDIVGIPDMAITQPLLKTSRTHST